MKKTILSSLFFFTLHCLMYAQGRFDYRKSFTEGSYLLIENNYSHALQSFLEAYQIDSSNANINYKIGLCYLKTVTERAQALPYLKKAVLDVSTKYTDMEPQEKSAPIQAYYYYGQALNFNYQFDEAIVNYEKFKTFLGTKQTGLVEDVDRQLEISKNAKILVDAPINVIIKTIGDSINSPYPDYTPLLSADEKTIIFTSRRPGSTGGDKSDDGQFYEDIYIAYKRNDSTWGTATSISTNINTITHEATVGLTAAAQTLLIYKSANGGDIYFSNLVGNSWSVPESMGSAINTPSMETSACLSPDGNTLYFVSDRKGGLGGRDIWKCIKLPDRKWSLAQNVGAPINTPYDEESPYIHPSGNVLFFSSNGHQTIGGFDIFFSTRGEKGWNEPLNIGYPINTTDDDIYYVTSPDGKRGYFTSASRPEGLGDKDIYMVTIPERKEEPLVLIKGTIIPAKGDEIPSSLEIIAKNNETGIISGTYTPLIRDGRAGFIIIIPPNSNYNFSYQNDGQEFYNETMEVPADAAYKEITKVLYLKPMKSDRPLEIKALEDDSDTKGTVVAKEIAVAATTKVKVNKKDKNSTKKEKINKKNNHHTTIVEEQKKDNKQEQLAKVENLNFQMFFRYNIAETNVEDAQFKVYIDNLLELYNTKGVININIISSSSQVPTRAYKSNKELAIVRSEKLKEQLITALKNKGVNSEKIIFSKVESYVGGPQYKINYEINKVEYEKYQFVKVSAY